MPEMNYATLLTAAPPRGSFLDALPDAITQTQVRQQAQWPALLIQTHLEPATVAPTWMKPVPKVQLILRRVGASQMTLTGGGRLRHFRPRPGDLFLTAANQPAYEMRRESLCGQPVQSTHLYLEPALVAQTAAATLGIDPASVELREGSCLRDPLLNHLVRALGEELATAPASSLFTDTAAQLVAAQLLRQHCSVRHAVPKGGGKLPAERLRQLTDYIQANLTQPISLAELASLACLSPYHFCRVFRRSTGQSPNQYVIAQRLTEARQLLRAGHTGTQAAYAVGYDDPRYFARLFRQHVGCTPAQYQQQLSS